VGVGGGWVVREEAMMGECYGLVGVWWCGCWWVSVMVWWGSGGVGIGGLAVVSGLDDGRDGLSNE